MLNPTKKFVIPIHEDTHELISFLNRDVLPFHREGNYYFTFTINRSGAVANRKVQRADMMYDNDKYDSNPPFAVIKPESP